MRHRLHIVFRLNSRVQICILIFSTLLICKNWARVGKRSAEKNKLIRVNQMGEMDTSYFMAAFMPKGVHRSLSLLNEFNDPKSEAEKETFYVESDFIDYAESLISPNNVPPRTLRDSALSKIHKVSLVISHCDHPVDWIVDLTAGLEHLIESIFIFSKCGQKVSGAPEDAQIIELPNVGRCDHTYAHWLNHYFRTDLTAMHTTDRIVVFMKDTNYQMLNGEKESFRDMLSLAVLNGMGCLRIRVVMLSSLIFQYDTLREFVFLRESYQRMSGPNENLADVPFHNEQFLNLGDWIDKMQITSVQSNRNLVSECFGGFFAVTSKQIAKQPQSTWKAIEDSLSRGDNIVEGHYAERLWGCLFSKPVSDETADVILGMNHSFETEWWPLRGMLKV